VSGRRKSLRMRRRPRCSPLDAIGDARTADRGTASQTWVLAWKADGGPGGSRFRGVAVLQAFFSGGL